MQKIIDSRIVELGGRKIKVMLMESTYGNPEDNKTIIRPYARYEEDELNTKNRLNPSGVIHFNSDGKYLCNGKVNPSFVKICEDVNKVNCKNCLMRLGKKSKNYDEKITNTKIFTPEVKENLRKVLDKTKL